MVSTSFIEDIKRADNGAGTKVKGRPRPSGCGSTRYRFPIRTEWKAAETVR